MSPNMPRQQPSTSSKPFFSLSQMLATTAGLSLRLRTARPPFDISCSTRPNDSGRWSSKRDVSSSLAAPWSR